MNLNLDITNREFIEIEIVKDGQTHIVKFYKQNGKQKQEQRDLLKKEETRIFEVEELLEKQFFERLKGDAVAIDSIKNFYDENGDISEFMKECEEVLGKQKRKA